MNRTNKKKKGEDDKKNGIEIAKGILFFLSYLVLKLEELYWKP